MPQCQVLIAKPGISVSTKTVYEMLDARTLRPEDHPDIDGMVEAIRKGISMRWQEGLEMFLNW